MAALVLHLGEKGGLAAEGGRAGQPIPLGKLAHDLAMGVLTDLSGEGAAVGSRHPGVRLDTLLGVDPRLEAGGEFGIFQGLHFVGGVQGLRVHGSLPRYR